MKEKKKLVFKSEIKNLNVVQEFVEEISDQYNVTNTYFGNILVAVTEAAKNAIIHGNKEDTNKEVVISYTYSKGLLRFCLQDEGEGFNYDDIPDPVVSDNSEKGLYLIRSLSDDVIFRNSGSTIELSFNIKGIGQKDLANRQSLFEDYAEEKKKDTPSLEDFL